MSLFFECIKNGEVKKVVNSFVDAFEDMFDCSVGAISIDVFSGEEPRIQVLMEKEI